MGMSPCNLWRKVLVKSLQHRVAAFAVNLPDQFYVFIEETVASHFICDILVEGRGMQVGSLF